jgi:hypothetical protein
MNAERGEAPHFVIVGSPRAGTTLVQRLASELPGVRVPPETHFFTLFYEAKLRRLRFPLSAPEARLALGEYLSIPAVAGLPLDPDDVVDQLDAGAPDAWALFRAVMRALAGDAHLVGEKTPTHLRWWRPMSVASPTLKFIAVLRDPRAVVASGLDVPFGMDDPALLAASWSEDVRDMRQASSALGEARFLCLRYEQVVIDPDAARSAIGAFLGLAGGLTPAEGVRGRGFDLFPEWERSWKGRADGPVDPGRVEAWRETLVGRDLRKVEAVAGRASRESGYEIARPQAAAWVRDLTLWDWLRLARLRWSRTWHRVRLKRLALG